MNRKERIERDRNEGKERKGKEREEKEREVKMRKGSGAPGGGPTASVVGGDQLALQIPPGHATLSLWSCCVSPCFGTRQP